MQQLNNNNNNNNNNELFSSYKYIVKDHYVAASAMADLSMLLVKQEKFEEAQHIAKYAKYVYLFYIKLIS